MELELELLLPLVAVETNSHGLRHCMRKLTQPAPLQAQTDTACAAAGAK